MQCKAVLTCESVDNCKILQCDRLNESYEAVLFCGTVDYANLCCTR